MTTLTPPPKTDSSSPQTASSISAVSGADGIRFLKRIGYSTINTHANDSSAFFYEAGLIIDADGSPRAYHPDGASGLDYLSNAGRPGDWWGVVTDNGRSSGKPVIQTPNDPAPGFYVSMTTFQDSSFDREDPRRYVNAEAINFIVLPGGLNLKATLGDYAVIIRPETRAVAYAVYADIGPSSQIGEGSIALANALGVPSSAKTGGVTNGVVYIVFPGSAKTLPLSQLTQSDINLIGAELFISWGGMDRAQSSFSHISWVS